MAHLWWPKGISITAASARQLVQIWLLTPWQDPNCGKHTDCTWIMIKPSQADKSYAVQISNPIPFKFLQNPVWWKGGGHVEMKKKTRKCMLWWTKLWKMWRIIIMRDHNRYGYPGTGSSGNELNHIQKLKDSSGPVLAASYTNTDLQSSPWNPTSVCWLHWGPWAL